MEIEKTEKYIAVHGDFKVLSSAVYNGGFVSAKTILNLNVGKDFKGNAFELFDRKSDLRSCKRRSESRSFSSR